MKNNEFDRLPTFDEPNYTPIPNVFFDELTSILTLVEQSILLIIFRFTFGWGNKEYEAISLHQILRYTDLSEATVKKHLKSLSKKDLIKIYPPRCIGDEDIFLRLNIEPADF